MRNLENIKTLTQQLKCGLYVDYGKDLETAFDAANMLATSSRDPAAVYTALFGVVNTICNVIDAEVEEAEEKLTYVRSTLEDASKLVNMYKNHMFGGVNEEVNDAKAPATTKP